MVKKTCFIVMPISTPKELTALYQEDQYHFEHVRECLLIPAIQEANFEPISPVREGSEVIHSQIIKLAMNSDLVLIDMSALNANVFFEWGMRTALNKPISVIVDDLWDKKVPFDIGLVNYYKYGRNIEPWNIEKEISDLSKHITDSYELSEGINSLWNHFGLTTSAQPPVPKTGQDAELEIIRMEIQGMKNILKSITNTPEKVSQDGLFEFPVRSDIKDVIGVVKKTLQNKGLDGIDELKILPLLEGGVAVHNTKSIAATTRNIIRDAFNRYETKVTFMYDL